ncbi:hypothetical protein LTR72_006750 [Exophiala xenobiotica]|nr:hypothetical protein LTR92_006805 [Exophiala xenobiotica]KAK5221190.1 hypothetical protein LTR72_006750 [Exophiala xenobiotica]KAK5286068.1 hypothetical protein LTR14_010322 [Exophiala xenobiotica]KAK5449150.1 hypothetical protein LTR18_002239 [Exophiala xenobiotica]KAK5474165.1 hypothetical protein LTR55_009952 [Exophiala xenobiotica]
MGALKCQLCDRTYSKTEHLKRHQRSHTKERPYQCPVCKKYFSRSDVLRRHQKNHENLNETAETFSKRPTKRRKDNSSRGGANAPNNNALASTDQIQEQEQLSPSHVVEIGLLGHGSGHEALLQGPDHGAGEGVAVPATQVIDQWHDGLMGQDSTGHDASYDASAQDDQVTSINVVAIDDSTGPGTQSLKTPSLNPDVNINSFTFASPAPTNEAPALGKDLDVFYSFPTAPPMDDLQLGEPTDLLDSWLFQYDPGSLMNPLPDFLPGLLLPTWNSASQLGIFSENHVAPKIMDGSITPTIRFMDRVSTPRFQKISSHWQSRSSRTTRLMPSLWHDLSSSERRNLYCKNVLLASKEEARQSRVSRWGFDDECRQQMQLTLNSLTQASSVCSPLSTESVVPDDASRSNSTTSYHVGEVTLPSTETCEVALEIYFHQFHPMLPVIHLPTFSAKGAPFTMLFVLCLLGFSILGTPSATKLVSETFPMVIQLVSTELQSTTARKGSPAEQATLLVTALLTLSLAAITGQNSRRMAQAEMLHVSLISIAQWHGLFFVNGDSVTEELDAIHDNEKRWYAWGKIECVKRLIVGLVEIDDWFASYFSTSPMIRPELLQILPPSENKVFHASTASLWIQYIKNNGGVHTPSMATSFDPSLDQLRPTVLPAMLTLLQHQIYEANHRLLLSNARLNPERLLEPWQLYTKEASDLMLISRVATLPATGTDPLTKADINGLISWHMSCMMLSANIRLFEDAAGRSGPAAVSVSMSQISRWSSTSTARRAVLHSAQVFKLLFHRRISDVISVHAVAALFKSALILSFYLLTAPINTQSNSERPLELFDEIDWSHIGACGLADVVDPSIRPCQTTTPDSHAMQFIRESCPFSITGIVHPPGYSSCGRVLLHAADLMQTLGKWKSRTFSQILHLLTDDLMDIDGTCGEDEE